MRSSIIVATWAAGTLAVIGAFVLVLHAIDRVMEEKPPEPVPAASIDINDLYRKTFETGRATGRKECQIEHLEQKRRELERSIAFHESALGLGPPVTTRSLGAGGAP